MPFRDHKTKNFCGGALPHPQTATPLELRPPNLELALTPLGTKGIMRGYNERWLVTSVHMQADTRRSVMAWFES